MLLFFYEEVASPPHRHKASVTGNLRAVSLPIVERVHVGATAMLNSVNQGSLE